MKVKELIGLLKQEDPEMEIGIYDCEFGTIEPIDPEIHRSKWVKTLFLEY